MSVVKRRRRHQNSGSCGQSSRSLNLTLTHGQPDLSLHLSSAEARENPAPRRVCRVNKNKTLAVNSLLNYQQKSSLSAGLQINHLTPAPLSLARRGEMVCDMCYVLFSICLPLFITAFSNRIAPTTVTKITPSKAAAAVTSSRTLFAKATATNTKPTSPRIDIARPTK